MALVGLLALYGHKEILVNFSLKATKKKIKKWLGNLNKKAMMALYRSTG